MLSYYQNVISKHNIGTIHFEYVGTIQFHITIPVGIGIRLYSNIQNNFSTLNYCLIFCIYVKTNCLHNITCYLN